MEAREKMSGGQGIPEGISEYYHSVVLNPSIRRGLRSVEKSKEPRTTNDPNPFEMKVCVTQSGKEP